MEGIRNADRTNVPIIGICNGFQILTESGLLPGAFLKNDSTQFRCEWVHVRVERNDTQFTKELQEGQVLSLPIAHGEGNYYANPDQLSQIEDNGQVLFRYCDEKGQVTKESNPNGSCNNIAGLLNENYNVLGMMPHPERASEVLLGGTDGLGILRSFIS
jgi:phosphoribosylformylglycinamidine synthase